MATLTETFNAKINLNGKDLELDNTLTVTLTDATNRVARVPSGSEVELVKIGAAIGAGQLKALKYFAIANIDSTNFIRLRFEDTGGFTADVKIAAGEVRLFHNDNLSVSETGVAFAAFANIDTISAQADTADVSVEFIAGE